VIKLTSTERQWGRHLSPHAISMVQTKLELDVQPLDQELELFLQNLDGMKNLTTHFVISSQRTPDYTYKSAEDIVSDYLENVFTHVLETMENLSKKHLQKFAVDLVITVPTVSFFVGDQTD
jgi:hypothetical protein